MNTDIRLSVEFFNHPKTVKLQRRLGLEAVICLQKLWLWAAQNRPEGRLSNMDAEDIEIAAKWGGDNGSLCSTLVSLGWIDEANGHYMLHDWEEHNPWQAEAEARSEIARKAAKARWENAGAPKPHKGKDANSMLKQCSSNAQAYMEQCPSPLLSSPVQTKEENTPTLNSYQAIRPAPAPESDSGGGCISESELLGQMDDRNQGDIGFQQFLEAYPESRRDTGSALTEWCKLRKARQLPGLSRLFQAIENWEMSEQWQKDNGQFVPMASNFLAKRKWLDQPPSAPARASPQQTTRMAERESLALFAIQSQEEIDNGNKANGVYEAISAGSCLPA